MMKKAKDADEYIAHQRQAIAQNPECGNSHYNLAVALIGQKKYDEAESIFKNIINRFDKCIEAYNGLACVRWEMGGKLEAIELFK